MLYTKEQWRTMSQQDLETILNREVYKAAILFEDLEHAGRLCGHGHHMAQEVARFAVTLLRKRISYLLEMKPCKIEQIVRKKSK